MLISVYHEGNEYNINNKSHHQASVGNQELRELVLLPWLLLGLPYELNFYFETGLSQNPELLDIGSLSGQ